MKYSSTLLFHVILLFPLCLWSQTARLTGRVTSEGKVISYARVALAKTGKGTLADTTGFFQLEKIPAGIYELRVSSLGFAGYSRQIRFEEGEKRELGIELQAVATEMDEVVITGTKKETYIKDSPIKVEVITQRFLQLNPTNNIIEAMETVNGVQEQINCGVCGTNDIHINGMEGPYTLVMIDGMPIVSALSSVYGFNGIPTHLVERIEIVKGPASSLYGTEAVGGVINIITKRPSERNSMDFNGFYTSHREGNVDLAGTIRLGDRLATLISANYYGNQFRIDANGDGFTDIPLNQRLSVFNKWEWQRKDDRLFNLAARYYQEDRFGGVMDWKPKHKGSSEVYGESIRTERVELIGNYQLPFRKEDIRVEYSFNHHYQDSYYGNTSYEARQSILFTNLIWDKSTRHHDLLVGGTFRYQYYDDNTPATPAASGHVIPGLFIQDEIKAGEKMSLLGGLRLDHHSDHSWVLTPRFAVKYKPSEWTTLRLNTGKGFRVVNLFTEDHAALTGSRTVVIEEALKPEQSYNVNLNFSHVFLTGSAGTGTFSIDGFYTYFLNKIIPDYEVDPDLIVYDNLEEHAIVRGFSVALDQNFVFPLKLKVGITYQDVYEVGKDVSGQQSKIPQVFAPRFSGTFGVSYEQRKAGLAVHLTGRVVGPQHLPTYSPPFERPERSPWYSLMNVQVTQEISRGVQVYGGVKNILNWTQESPLIDPSNPFGDDFDTAYAYGPLQPRRMYAGLRIRLR